MITIFTFILRLSVAILIDVFRQTAEVLCEDVFISDAEVFIVKGLTGKFRLIIVSRNKCTIISQVCKCSGLNQ